MELRVVVVVELKRELLVFSAVGAAVVVVLGGVFVVLNAVLLAELDKLVLLVVELCVEVDVLVVVVVVIVLLWLFLDWSLLLLLL